MILMRGIAMNKNEFAPNPPMGWNSWDCYGAAVTEEILLRNADYMAENLLKYGWEYIVCDIQWYEPKADSSHYRKFADLCIDEYGRVIPAPNRFPSSAGGKGFKYIADYVHNKGMKFGIHIMRGIPRQAVAQNTIIKGTSHTAREVAHPNSICSWNTDMYGIDHTKPGAQEYYDSIIELYASWGVDFIKVDDICVKQTSIPDALLYGGDEIELIRNAIDKCGRPIVLSLSPGPAMIEKAEHLRKNANMWRMTNDLWDRWEDIEEMFERCARWSPYVSDGCFPDCDMLPLGHLSIVGCEHGVGERWTRLSQAEQRTMISLWSIFRSPMMLGCELTNLDEWTLNLLTNQEILEMLKKSRGAHQILRDYDLIVWKADKADGGTYVAVFNICNWTDDFSISLNLLGLEGSYVLRDLWEQEEMGVVNEAFETTLTSHDAKVFSLTKCK